MHLTWLDKYFRGDRTIWMIVFFLSLFSLVAVYSSTGTLAYRYQRGNTEYYLVKHLFILVFGIGLMYAAHLVKYTYYSRISQIALLLAIPLLALTLAMGTNLNEASRWLTLPGINLSFQTSDLAKLALIMYLARILSKKQENIKDFKTSFVPIMLPVLVICGLILPANLSTAAVLFATCCFLMFIGRINLKYILLMGLTGMVCVSLFIGIALLSKSTGRVGTWKARIENFAKGDDHGNYQTQQAKIAIATGGLIGKFPGHSTQKNFLPHPYSDFIYAIIIEEEGSLGGIFIIFLYVLLFFRVIRFVNHSPLAFGTLLAVGCTFSLVFQAMINMAVAVHLFPVTGQPLPMLSMGGTSIWFTSIAIGIVLSVSRQVEKEKKKEEMNLPPRKIKVIISGGGTGGHIFPAIAIANALKAVNRENEILFVGANGRMEMEKVPAAGYVIEGLNISGIQRKLTWSNLLVPFKVISSVMKAKKIIKRFKPDVAVGVGGYASAPLLFAATSMKIPSLIQEQNSYAGITNKILSKRVQRICVAYDGMEKYFLKEKIMMTGNPVRMDIQQVDEKRKEALKFFRLSAEKKTMLVIGGSLGARTINESIAEGLSLINENNIQLIWQTGKIYFQKAKSLVNEQEENTIRITDFIQRMDLAYAAADIVVSRAGAGSVSELALVAKPVILVPSPNVAEDHQTKNAMALVNKQAAILVKDSEAKENLVHTSIELIRDEQRQNQLKENISKLALRNSAEKIANEIYELAEIKSGN